MTNGSLRRRFKTGELRPDFLYRLAVARIAIPPLRERREDIPLLVDAFLAVSRTSTGRPCAGLSPQVMEELQSWHWPGDVRELRNVVDHLSIHCQGRMAHVADLPWSREREAPSAVERSARPLPRARHLGREEIVAALASNDGNRSRAAHALGIGRATLYRKLKRLDIG